MKLARNGIAEDQNSFSVAGRFRLIQALEVWILGTATSCPLKTRLRYSQVPFKACFTLQNYGLLLLELTTNTAALT